MRDHATGAYGATAVALDVLVKAAALAAIAPGRAVVAYAAAAGALSRAVPVVLGLALASVREDGAGAAFQVPRLAALVAVATAAALAHIVGWAHGVLLIAAAAVLAVGLGAWFRRWLGGGTGDTLGAASELTETVLLAVASAL
jgi:adenosylcobinamide-GDP ribazoletransferase